MSDNELDEAVLTIQQRMARGRVMKRNKNKIKIARERSKKRLAPSSKLEVRSRKMAVKFLKKRLAGKMGAEYATLSPSQKIQIDKRIQGKGALIGKLAKRLFPKVRQAESERFRHLHDKPAEKTNESIVKTNWVANKDAGAGAAGSHQVFKKYQDLTPGQQGEIPLGNPSMDAPIKSFKEYIKAYNAPVHESVLSQKVVLDKPSHTTAMAFANRLEDLGLKITNITAKFISFKSTPTGDNHIASVADELGVGVRIQ